MNGRAKYNQLYTMITPGIEAVVDKQKGIQEDCFLKPDRLLHVFFSKDTIFSEEESGVLQIFSGWHDQGSNSGNPGIKKCKN